MLLLLARAAPSAAMSLPDVVDAVATGSDVVDLSSAT